MNVGVDNGGSPLLSITPLVGGTNVISGYDFFGRTYHIQFLTGAAATNWQTLGTATANPYGVFQSP